MNKTILFLSYLILNNWMSYSYTQEISLDEIVKDFLDLQKFYETKNKIMVIDELESAIKNHKNYKNSYFNKEILLCADSLSSNSVHELNNFYSSLKLSLSEIYKNQNKNDAELQLSIHSLKTQSEELSYLKNQRKSEKENFDINLNNLQNEINLVDSSLLIIKKHNDSTEFVQLNSENSKLLNTNLKLISEKSNNIDIINLELLQRSLSSIGSQDKLYLTKIYQFLTNLITSRNNKIKTLKSNFEIFDGDYYKLESTKQEVIENIQKISKKLKDKIIFNKKEINKLETSLHKLSIIKLEEAFPDPCSTLLDYLNLESKELDNTSQMISKYILLF